MIKPSDTVDFKISYAELLQIYILFGYINSMSYQDGVNHIWTRIREEFDTKGLYSEVFDFKDINEARKYLNNGENSSDFNEVFDKIFNIDKTQKLINKLKDLVQQLEYTQQGE